MRKWLLLCVLLVFGLPVSAQIAGDGTEEMVAFVAPALDVQGLRPATWVERQDAPGVFLRGSDPLDITGIIMQARPGTADELLREFAGSFSIENIPTSESTIEGEFFTFDYYQLERPRGEGSILIDIAVAESVDDERVYYVLMQTVDAFYDTLHESVFMPAVQWFGPTQLYTAPDESFSVNVPSLWTSEAVTVGEDDTADEYGVLTATDGTATVYVDAVQTDDPDAAVEAFWLQVDPDFSSTFDAESDAVTTITDPVRLGGLDEVIIINWEGGFDNEEGIVRQSVVRVLGDTAFITLIDATVESLLTYETSVGIIDQTFSITALQTDITGDPAPEPTAESDE
ncbi:MAG: hypothetical protein AAFR81_12670 [Chloroflexota bacterium]